MHASWMGSGRWLVALVASALFGAFAGTQAAGADASTAAPPEPEFPQRNGRSEQEYQTAREQWRTEYDAWCAGLTAAQVIGLQEQETRETDEKQEVYRQELRLPRRSDGYDWRKKAEDRGLPEEVIRQLERDQIAFSESRLQSFEPYLGGPVFITSDSLLNAFHVLFEDSFRELELRRAASLRADLEQLLAAVRKLPTEEDVLPRDRIAAATLHVERVLGPALVLMGAPTGNFSADVQEGIGTQLALIREATAVQLPWLAPSDSTSLAAIDYRRFKPVGFYADSPRLENYFRAVRWLQSVPFRAAQEHEFDAIVLLMVAGEETGIGRKLAAGTTLVGPADDPTIAELAAVLDRSFPRRSASFDARQATVRNQVAREFIEKGYYRVNSDLRLRATMAETFEQLTFRVISAAALPDSEAFQDMMARQMTPSGLALAALLGSKFADKRLDRNERAIVDELQPTWREGGRNVVRWDEPMLHALYLHALEALFQPAAPGSPAFMKREAWAAKSCQTALAGWAQMRHTFTLQAKMSAMYLGAVRVPPGFVEPNPEFFARTTRMIEAATDALAREGCFLPSAWEEADELRALAAFARDARWDDATGEDTGNFQDIERWWHAAAQAGEAFPSAYPDFAAEGFPQLRLDIIAALERKAAAIEQGELPLAARASPLQERWTTLDRAARRLESLAHKQLRGESWTVPEEEFLKEYGQTMAGVMGYYGNSWLTPRDDAPRAVEVCSFPARGRSLIAAAGRPRVIFVLYPWQGTEVFCTGSVMQYYEFEDDRALTDDEWRGRLDAETPPEIPRWLAPFASRPAKPPQRKPKD